MDKQRRKLLQNSAILGIASSMIGLSGVLGLQGCDSNPSKNAAKDSGTQGAAAGSSGADSTQHTKGDTMEFITFSLLIVEAMMRRDYDKCAL